MVQASTLDLKSLFVALLLLLALPACEGKIDNPLGINLRIRQEKLSNGLLLLMVEDHTVPIVSYQTWFRVGSVDEQPGCDEGRNR